MATATMAMLNNDASQAMVEAMVEVGVHACTDITGFGLTGHLHEVTRASGCGATVYGAQVPVIEGTLDLAADNIVPGGAYNNLQHMEDSVAWADAIPQEQRLGLCDPQTSGGLLIALPTDKVDLLMGVLERRGVHSAAVIGEIGDDPSASIQVLP